MKNQLNELLAYLQIPSIPKKVWDGKTSFDRGVAIVTRYNGEKGYVICSFQKETDREVRVIKDTAGYPFITIDNVYPIPAYMDDNIDKMELEDEESKDAMTNLIQEKKDLTHEGIERPSAKAYEWGYPFIKDKKQAIAFLKSKKVRGHIPEKEEVLKAKLKVMYNEDEMKKQQ